MNSRIKLSEKQKPPADGSTRGFRDLAREVGLSGQLLDSIVQTALVTSGLVLVNDAFVGNAIDNRYSAAVGLFRCFQVFGFNGAYNLLDVGADHGAQAGVVLASLVILARALTGLREVGH
jgi:hypothetical protein